MEHITQRKQTHTYTHIETGSNLQRFPTELSEGKVCCWPLLYTRTDFRSTNHPVKSVILPLTLSQTRMVYPHVAIPMWYTTPSERSKIYSTPLVRLCVASSLSALFFRPDWNATESRYLIIRMSAYMRLCRHQMPNACSSSRKEVQQYISTGPLGSTYPRSIDSNPAPFSRSLQPALSSLLPLLRFNFISLHFP